MTGKRKKKQKKMILGNRLLPRGENQTLFYIMAKDDINSNRRLNK